MECFTISTTTSQPLCKVVATLQGCEHLAQIAIILWQACHNLTKLQQGQVCYNLVISIWGVCDKGYNNKEIPNQILV